MSDKKYSFINISKYRGALLGIATLWVVFYHIDLPFFLKDGEGLKHIIYIIGFQIHQIMTAGQVGVDIFLILSAVGLYYSMEKDPDVLSFYKKRLLRILPAYIVVNVLWEIYLKDSFSEAINRVLGISFFTEGYRMNWYFVLIIFLYLLYPLIYRFIKKYGKERIIWLMLGSVLLNFLVYAIDPQLYGNIEIALRRIMSFLVGVYLSILVKEDRKANAAAVLLISYILMVFSGNFLFRDFSEDSVFYRTFCLVNAVSIILFLTALLPLFRKKGILGTFVDAHGKYSLEFYLIHPRIIQILAERIENELVIAFLSYVLSFTASFLISKMNKKLFLKKKN